MKYKMSRESLIKLINSTPIADNTSGGSFKVHTMYRQITKQLSLEEQEELKILLNKEALENGEERDSK